jgi:hypothetical protein
MMTAGRGAFKAAAVLAVLGVTVAAAAAEETVSSSQVIGAQGADEWLASQLRGTPVIGGDNQRIGEVVDILFDRNGQARAFVVGAGGVMGLGAKEIAIDIGQFHGVPAVNVEGARPQLKVSLTREVLAAIPEFKPLPVPDDSTTTGAATDDDGAAPH